MPFEFYIWLIAWAAFGRLVVIYGFGSPWRKSAIGRSLLPMKVALFLLFTWVLTIFLFGHYPASDLLRILCLSFVTFMALWQGRVWRRIQREAISNDTEERNEVL